MSTDEAKAFGIKEDQRKSYVRMDSAKINITRHGKTKWFRLIGVRLGNATEMYPNGDEVQTVEPWNPPETWADLSSDLLNKILTAIDSGLPDGNRYSDSHNAKERVAWKVVTEHAPQKTEAQAREIIKIANEPMKLLKTKQSEKDPVKSGSDLAERIKAARAEAEAFIDLKTAELKAAPDGALLPIGVLRQMITRHSRCACAVALNILEPKT